jgi:hypothetical protein
MILKLGFLVTLFLMGCAHVEPPSGGPEDLTPPAISGIYPAPGALKVDPTLDVHVQFNEWIQPRLPRGAVRISPPLEKGLITVVDGDYLIVQSRAKLDDSTTYIVMVSSDIQDLRGNLLGSPFQLVFSTGSYTDSLTLRGRTGLALDAKKQNQGPIPSIALYPIGALRQGLSYLNNYKDSLGLISSEPDADREPPIYITQADTSGIFQFQGLKPGHYRIVSFIDNNMNGRPDPIDELCGLGDSEIQLPDTSLFIAMVMGNMDTSGVELSSINVLPGNLISLSFTTNLIDTLALNPANYEIFGRDSTQKIYPQQVWLNPTSQQPVLAIDSLMPDSLYTLRALNLKDSLLRGLDPKLNQLTFTFSSPPDTTEPRPVKTHPATRGRGVMPGSDIQIFFDKPTAIDVWNNRFVLSFERDTLPYKLESIASNILRLIPLSPLGPDAEIKVSLLSPDTLLSTPDSAGKSDTTIRQNSRPLTQFETASANKMASLRGTIPGANEKTRIMLKNLQTGYLHKTISTPQGSFEFKDLIEGPHFMEYFTDTDMNNIRSPGSLKPWVTPEPLRQISDTLFIPRGQNHSLDSLLKEIPALPIPNRISNE